MERVPLGRTRVSVTRVGFGTAGIAGLYERVTPEQASATLDAAWTAGIRYFDTAPHYGVGLAEQRLGRALARWSPGEPVVSTKVGRLLVRDPRGPDPSDMFKGTPAYARVRDDSRRGAVRSLHESLERLGVDRVDVVFVHDPEEAMPQAIDEAFPALADLRDQKVVGAIGAGSKDAGVLDRFVADTDVDCVLVAGRYTMLDQSALSSLLPRCEQRGVSVIAGGVLNSGVLADPRPGAPYEYGPASAAVLERARRLRSVCDRHDTPLIAAALQFSGSHPAVASVLIGARSPAELRTSVALWSRRIPGQLWDELRAEGMLADGVPVPPDAG